MVGWNDFVPLTISHSSSLETFVPAKLVNLLVSECAANVLTTVKIYSYLCFPTLQSASNFSKSGSPLKFHPWPPVSENFLSVPALRSLSLSWVPTILARPSHLVFPLSAPGCLSSVLCLPSLHLHRRWGSREEEINPCLVSLRNIASLRALCPK